MKERKLQLPLFVGESAAHPYSPRESAGDRLAAFCKWTQMTDTTFPEGFRVSPNHPISSMCSSAVGYFGYWMSSQVHLEE